MLLIAMCANPPWEKIEVTQVQTYSVGRREREDGAVQLVCLGVGVDRRRRERVEAGGDLEDELDGEGDPHQPQEDEGHVPADVAKRAADAGVDPPAEQPAVVLGTHRVVEARIEDAVAAPGLAPLGQPGAVVGLGQPVFGTEGPPAVATLVRHALAFAAFVAVRHRRLLRTDTAKGLCLSARLAGDCRHRW